MLKKRIFIILFALVACFAFWQHSVSAVSFTFTGLNNNKTYDVPYFYNTQWSGNDGFLIYENSNGQVWLHALSDDGYFYMSGNNIMYKGSCGVFLRESYGFKGVSAGTDGQSGTISDVQYISNDIYSDINKTSVAYQGSGNFFTDYDYKNNEELTSYINSVENLVDADSNWFIYFMPSTGSYRIFWSDGDWVYGGLKPDSTDPLFYAYVSNCTYFKRHDYSDSSFDQTTTGSTNYSIGFTYDLETYIVASNFDFYYEPSYNVAGVSRCFFRVTPPEEVTGVLAPIVAPVEMKEPIMREITTLVMIMLPLLIAWIGLRKALAFLRRLLERCMI